MEIIDARMRVPFGAEGELLKGQRFLKTKKTFGLGCAPSAIYQNTRLLVSEMDTLGISRGLITGRGRFADRNGELLEFASLYQGYFCVLPYIDPTGEGVEDRIKEFSGNPLVKGYSIQYYSDDASCYEPLDTKATELYEAVMSTGLPLMVTLSGHTVRNLDSHVITELDQIAVMFPKLQLVITHGGWPWVLDTIGLAFRRQNVYLIPDCYCTNVPGAQEYVKAANYMIPDKILFASSYPLLSQEEMVNYYIQKAGFEENVLPKVMGENAKALFRL